MSHSLAQTTLVHSAWSSELVFLGALPDGKDGVYIAAWVILSTSKAGQMTTRSKTTFLSCLFVCADLKTDLLQLMLARQSDVLNCSCSLLSLSSI